MEANDDNVTVFVAIELKKNNIPYFISFYKRKNENQITAEGILNIQNQDDDLQLLLINLKKKNCNRTFRN